jgi:hypothetical protein
MGSKAAVTVMRAREEVERFWHDGQHRSGYVESIQATVRFVDAPGDRGTEIHVDVGRSAPGGVVTEAVQKLRGTEPVAKVKDELRRFKQRVETGEVARSEAVPEGELLERKLKQRPAQPLEPRELQKAGV